MLPVNSSSRKKIHPDAVGLKSASTSSMSIRIGDVKFKAGKREVRLYAASGGFVGGDQLIGLSDVMSSADDQNVGNRRKAGGGVAIGRDAVRSIRSGREIPFDRNSHVAGQGGPGVDVVLVLDQPLRDGAGISFAILPIEKPLGIRLQGDDEQADE